MHPSNLKKIIISFIFIIFTILIINVTNSYKFLSENYENILSVSILFIGLLVIFSILDIKFNDDNINSSKNSIINKKHLRENLDNIKPSNSFCDAPNGSLLELNKKCGGLTKENCNVTSCCIWLNGEKCVTGNASGPTFLTDENKEKINVDYYYYKNICNGKGCNK